MAVGVKSMGLSIIHMDMDAFFAAVEMRDNPELVGKPVIIGGDPRRDVRSVVSTASYEARKFGIRSAMPLVQAWRLCPQGIFLRGNMAKYSQVSREIMEILGRFTPLVEQISVDEAFLDIRGCERLFGAPPEIGRQIQAAVLAETGLSCSVGVAPNKFLAKLASDLKKPGGLTVIEEDKIREILDPLPVGKIWGVGAKTADKLHSMGLETIGQLTRLSRSHLEAAFGKLGLHIWHLARGEDARPVETSHGVKSLSRETTYAQDVFDRHELNATLLELAEDVARRMRSQGFTASTVTVKIRFGSFQTITRQGALPAPSCLTMPLYFKALELVDKAEIQGKGIRLIGVGASALSQGGVAGQLSLFPEESDHKQQRIAEAVDQIWGRYGSDSIRRGALLTTKNKEPHKE